MKNKIKAFNNIKVCAFLSGIIMGTIVYNLLCVDFSFAEYYVKCFDYKEKIESINFEQLYFYLLYQNFRTLVFIDIICLVKYKKLLTSLYIFYVAFTIAVIISLSVSIKNSDIALFTVMTTIPEKIMAFTYMFIIERIINKINEMFNLRESKIVLANFIVSLLCASIILSVAGSFIVGIISYLVIK